MAGDLDDTGEEIAADLCAKWGCGVPAEGRTARHDALAERVAKLQGLPEAPAGCPFAPLYHATPLVIRAARGLARMEAGWSPEAAFDGHVGAVDVRATDLIRRGQSDRDRSDHAHREKERKQRELAEKAGRP